MYYIKTKDGVSRNDYNEIKLFKTHDEAYDNAIKYCDQSDYQLMIVDIPTGWQMVETSVNTEITNAPHVATWEEYVLWLASHDTSICGVI